MSGKIKATVVDRANAIAHKVITKFEATLDASNWSQADLAKAAGITLADVEVLLAGQGRVQPWFAATNTLRLELSTLAEGDYLAQQLLNTRDGKGLSVGEIADKTGLSIATIQDLENGVGNLRDLFLLLAVIAPRAGCRKAKKGFGKRDKVDSDSRFTSPEFMNAFDIAFGDIDVDPCGHTMSPVVAADRIMLSEGRDGLREDWRGRVVFVNPPFSAQLDFLERAHDQWASGNAQIVVCLVPAKTCNNFFHSTLYRDADFYMIKGRPRFGDANEKWEGTKYSLMVVMFGATYRQKALFAELVEGKWGRFFDTKPVVQHWVFDGVGDSSVNMMSCASSRSVVAVHCGADA